MKKILTGCVLAMLICFVMPCLSIEAQATNKTQQEALEWVKSKVGTGIDTDGYPKSQPYQCVDLIMAYYQFLGEKSPGGNGCDYATNALPSGWTRIQGATPQPGDILVYAGGGSTYGHVAIFESTYSTYHQNFNSHPYVERVTYAYNVLSTPYWGVIRPNFIIRNWYDSFSLANLGTEFYAEIARKDTGTKVGNVSGNVELVNTTSAASAWKFVRQGDGSYIIYNCDGYKVMDAADAGTTDGTNVWMYDKFGEDNQAQKWYIYQAKNGGYIFRSKLSAKVLDASQGYSTPGTNIHLWEYIDYGAQIFSIKTLEPAKSTNVSLKMLGDASHKTMIAWNGVKGAESYNIRIKKGTAGNVTTYQDLTGVKGTSVEVQLEPGYYEVYVEAYNYFSSAKSNTISFTVKERANVAESFGDVSSWNWFVEPVQYVFDHGLMNGSGGLFQPKANITRAQLVTTLYRLAGEPAVTDKTALELFYDVAEGKYYTDAVCWAYAEGIATGSDWNFNPTGNLTRQQLATFFYRYAEYEGRDISIRGDISSMLNADKVSDYAKDAVEWAVGAGLISGSETKDESGNTVYDLNPKGNTTRAQVAAILMRFCEENNI